MDASTATSLAWIGGLLIVAGVAWRIWSSKKKDTSGTGGGRTPPGPKPKQK